MTAADGVPAAAPSRAGGIAELTTGPASSSLAASSPRGASPPQALGTSGSSGGGSGNGVMTLPAPPCPAPELFAASAERALRVNSAVASGQANEGAPTAFGAFDSLVTAVLDATVLDTLDTLVSVSVPGSKQAEKRSPRDKAPSSARAYARTLAHSNTRTRVDSAAPHAAVLRLFHNSSGRGSALLHADAGKQPIISSERARICAFALRHTVSIEQRERGAEVARGVGGTGRKEGAPELLARDEAVAVAVELGEEGRKHLQK